MDIKRGFPFWFLIGFGIFLTLIFLLGQTMALINYDLTVQMGLQEPASMVTAVGVAFNKGFGFGDTLVYIPLFIAGIAGLLKRKEYGFYAMIGALSITMYWPAVSLGALYFAKEAPGFQFSDYTTYSVVLIALFLYGLWGCCYLFSRRNKLIMTNTL